MKNKMKDIAFKIVKKKVMEGLQRIRKTKVVEWNEKTDQKNSEK